MGGFLVEARVNKLCVLNYWTFWAHTFLLSLCFLLERELLRDISRTMDKGFCVTFLKLMNAEQNEVLLVANNAGHVYFDLDVFVMLGLSASFTISAHKLIPPKLFMENFTPFEYCFLWDCFQFKADILGSFAIFWQTLSTCGPGKGFANGEHQSMQALLAWIAGYILLALKEVCMVEAVDAKDKCDCQSSFPSLTVN